MNWRNFNYGLVFSMLGAWLFILLIACLLSGCAINESKETVTLDPVTKQVKYESKVWQGLFLYYTKTKEVDQRTPFSSVTIGEIVSEPDPNSIKALGGAVGTAAKEVVR